MFMVYLLFSILYDLDIMLAGEFARWIVFALVYAVMQVIFLGGSMNSK